MFSDVLIKLKKRNKILFSRDSLCLKELTELIRLQSHRTLVMWALDCAKLPLERFEAKYPDEKRPRACLELCGYWARGQIKMPAAKRAILDSHAAAKNIESGPANSRETFTGGGEGEYAALCHSIGHAGATVHVETHAIGLPMYELTAMVLRYGKDDFSDHVSEKIDYYRDRLLYWQENTDKLHLEWADFLLDDSRPNKEWLLNERRKK